MTSADLTDRDRPLTGRMVLLILVAFFGIVAAVNAIMIHYAISTFPGVDDDQPYEHGLAYDRDVAAAHAQDRLGWQVAGHVSRNADGQTTLTVSMRDNSGLPVTGLDVSGQLAFMPDRHRDHLVRLIESAPGDYRTGLNFESGAWELEMTAAKAGEIVYKSRNRLDLK